MKMKETYMKSTLISNYENKKKYYFKTQYRLNLLFTFVERCMNNKVRCTIIVKSSEN